MIRISIHILTLRGSRDGHIRLCSTTGRDEMGRDFNLLSYLIPDIPNAMGQNYQDKKSNGMPRMRLGQNGTLRASLNRNNSANSQLILTILIPLEREM